ncbi:MAG: hypothetical protein H6635_03235 [Anaerolineales bacterium]|nr:hypothetical protein [Anaerolineales bacterium]
MKNLQIKIAISLCLVGVFVVLAAIPMGGTRSLSLLDIQSSGGLVEINFYYTGEFRPSELNGWISLSGEGAKYEMDCEKKVFEGVIACSTFVPILDKDAVIELAGFRFWIHVPLAKF